VDFTDTRPLVFSKADEPLAADDWLRTMEQKFELIQCMEYQKPMFAAQQLRGAAWAWWANLVADGLLATVSLGKSFGMLSEHTTF
jgi:hypothetical protein